MTVCDLANRDCVPCAGGTPPLTPTESAARMPQLHADWTLGDNGTTLTRRFAFKGFAKAVQLANLAAWHSEKLAHHADIRFGYGYCEIRYTTHEIAGLSENDFIAAARLDQILA